MTRMDAAIGNNRVFNESLFDVVSSRLFPTSIRILTVCSQLLGIVAQVGNDSSVTGPKSIVNVASMQEFKFQRFVTDQVANPEVSRRLLELL